MEPLTAGAIALATGIVMKVLEKTGENIGDVLQTKFCNLINSLQQHSPQTVTAIEKLPNQSLDYGETVLEIQTVANKDEQVKLALEELVKAVQSNHNPQVTEQIKQESQKIINIIKNQRQTNQVFNNKIEKLINLAQGNATINIENQNITL